MKNKEIPLYDPNDIQIDVYYKNKKDVFYCNSPYEVVLTLPECLSKEPIYLSNILPSVIDIKDTTEMFEINRYCKPNLNHECKRIKGHKIRTGLIEFYGTVNYHIGDPKNKPLKNKDTSD